MALVEKPFISMNDGTVVGTYTYDDATNLMTQVKMTNNGAVGVASYAFFNIADNTLAASGRVAVGAAPLVTNLIPLGIHMILGGPSGVALLPPFYWTVNWTPA